MALEAATYINGLVATNPANADPVQQGADHLRLLKSTIKASFPSITGAVTATQAQINGWDARIAALETNRARKDVADTFAASMAFAVGLTGASVARAGNELDPIGVPKFWATGTPPAGHLLLDGSAVSRATYSALFALWGTKYGVGDGSTTFNLPDWRLKFPMGAGTGAALDATGGSQTPAVVVVAGGDHNHGSTTGAGGDHNHGSRTGGTAISVAQMPAHTHGVVDPGHAHGYLDRINAGGGEPNVNGAAPGGSDLSRGTGGAYTGISIASNGSGAAHDHAISASGTHTHTISASGTHTHTATIADGRPPFVAVNFIVRAL